MVVVYQKIREENLCSLISLADRAIWRLILRSDCPLISFENTVNFVTACPDTCVEKRDNEMQTLFV